AFRSSVAQDAHSKLQNKSQATRKTTLRRPVFPYFCAWIFTEPQPSTPHELTEIEH
ncbi:hypothetical protein M513_12217, partial [Trichuris suis]